MAIEAPLTYGQLSTWRSIETFAADRLMEVNVPATWDVRGLSRSEILSALARLTDRHESLRTTYHVVDGQPVQRIHQGVSPRIAILERDDTDQADAARTTRDLYRIPLPVIGDLGWHGSLVTTGGEPSFLALSLSHMVVDLWAVQRLEHEFRTLASANLPAPRPRELAERQRGEGWESRRKGAEKYWRRMLSLGPVRNLPAPPQRNSERRIQVTWESGRLGVLAAAAARRHNVSPQSVLMAMTAAALGHGIDADRVMLSLMSANRSDLGWRDLVSTMNQLIPLACDVSPLTTVVKQVKGTHLQALLAYRYASYDVDRAAELAAGTGFEHDCWFNFLVEPTSSAPVFSMEPATLRWTDPPRHAGHPFYVRITGQERVTVTLRVDPDIITADAAVEVLHIIARGVEAAAIDPERTLGSLRTGALDPLLFPRSWEAQPTVS